MTPEAQIETIPPESESQPDRDPGGIPGIEPAAPHGPGSIEQLVKVVKARKWLMLAAALVMGLAAFVISASESKEYKATASLLFAPPATADFVGSGTLRANEDPQRASVTREELLKLDGVARRTARSLGNGTSESEVADAVSLGSRKDSDVVEIEARADSARRAARLANTYAVVFSSLRNQADRRQLDQGIARLRRQLGLLTIADRQGAPGRDLQNRINELVAARALETGNVELVQRARPPEHRESAHVLRNTALGLVAGALLALLLGSLLERVDRRVKTVEELEEIYELPVVGRIPRSRALNKRSDQAYEADILSKASGFSEDAEAFRALRASLRYLNIDRDLRSCLVASPMPGDGKSTIARFLAVTMAAMGDSVVLVDADLRKFAHNVPSVSQAPEGLSLVLAGFDLDEALTEVLVAYDPVSQGSRGLVELPSGPLPPNPAELLESDRMAAVIKDLESRFDRVIIDSPAIASVSDALALVPQVSGVLVVSSINHTTRSAAVSLQKQLKLQGGRPIGVVANFWSPEGNQYYYYRYDRS